KSSQPVDTPNVRIQIQQTAGPAVIQLSDGPINEDIPALVIPVASHVLSSETKFFSFPFPEARRIVTLDLETIRTSLFPELVNRYFVKDGRREYSVAIVKRDDPASAIYESEEGVAGAKADVTASVMKLRLSEVNRMFFAKFPGEKQSSQEKPETKNVE